MDKIKRAIDKEDRADKVAELVAQAIQEERLHDYEGQGESECCGYGTYGDYKICERCGEHC